MVSNWETPVLVCSLTKSAAAEIGGRDMPIEKGAVGTLHSHCYHQLGRPRLVTRDDARLWNVSHSLQLLPEKFPRPRKKGSDDDGLDDATPTLEDARVLTPATVHGQGVFDEVELLRHKRVPREQWQAELSGFYDEWCEFKREREREIVDFTDLIEGALVATTHAPGRPWVILADECQDLSRLEYQLLKHWGERAAATIFVGDPLQSIYSFRGASPDLFEDPDIPTSHRRVLSQSYRVPRLVLEASVHWVRGQIDKEPAKYKPRADPSEPERPRDGWVEVAEHQYKFPRPFVREVIERLEADPAETVMIQVTCAYMLIGILGELRYQGVPFSNPWKRCSPSDELILTSDGWVEISKLDPKVHRLAGFYRKAQLSWGPHWRRDGTKRASGPHRGDRRGFAFSVGKRDYSGKLLTITTERTRTRVTPNHRIIVKLSETFYGSWVVYLMRRVVSSREVWWRIGMCQSPIQVMITSSPGHKLFRNGGVCSRLGREKADGAWILSVHRTRAEAAIEEIVVQSQYGLAGTTFEGTKGRPRRELREIHRRLSEIQQLHAIRLLEDRGLDRNTPLYKRDRTLMTGYAFETAAANVVVLSGLFEVPTIPERFVEPGCPRCEPEFLEAEVSTSDFSGEVYSLDVPGPERYASGGAVVHNSRGDWNPLSGDYSTAEKLASVLTTCSDSPEIVPWTYTTVGRLLKTLKATGTLRRGVMKGALETCKSYGAHPESTPTALELEEWFGGADSFLYKTWVGEVTEREFMDWWFDHRKKPISASFAQYLRYIVQRRGSSGLRDEPRVFCGTIHSFKGGEASISYVFPDLSPTAHLNWGRVGSEERAEIVREFYVAMTRSQEGLVICRNSSTSCVPLRREVDSLLMAGG